MLMFERAAGVRARTSLQGLGDVRTALASKQIEVAAINIGESLQAVRGGAAMRNLGQFSPARNQPRPGIFRPARSRVFDFELSRCAASPRLEAAPEIRERLRSERWRARRPIRSSRRRRSGSSRAALPESGAVRGRSCRGRQQFRQLWKELPWADR